MRLIAVIVLLVAVTAAAKPKKPRKSTTNRPTVHAQAGRCRFEMPVRGAMTGEFGDGLSLAQLEVIGGAVDATVIPRLRCLKGRLIASLRLSGSERATQLEERRLGASLELRGRPTVGVWLSLRPYVRWLDRADWPDPYQPLVDAQGQRTGGLDVTNRRGGLRFGLGAEIEVRLPRRVDLRVDVDWMRRDDVQDADFDAVLRPDHLTPSDGDRFRGRLRARTRRGPWRVEGTAEVSGALSDFAFSRDAVTGATHAGVGGSAPNPLKRTVGGAGRLSASLWALKRTKVTAILAVGGVGDLHEGYDSTWFVGGEVGVVSRPWRGLGLRADYRVRLTRYTSDGYGETADHPPLDFGDRRERLTHIVRGELSYRVLRLLEPFVAARLEVSDTNFPDYVPFVHPVTAPFAVDFDWRRWEISLGLRFAL